MDKTPYTFALRAAAFAAVFAASLFGADAVLTALAIRGVRIVPKVPPSEVTTLLSSKDALLVLGNSVMTYLPKGDRGPTLVDDVAREVRVPVVDASHRGRGAAMVAAQIEALLRLGVRPRAVLVEVNPANFGPEWERHPGMQEPDVNLVLARGVTLPVRAAAVFKYKFGLPTVEEYLATPLWVADRQIGTVRDMVRPTGYTDQETAPSDIAHRRWVARYAPDAEHSSTLGLLSAAIGKLRAADIPTIAFLTPLDLGTMRGTLPPEELSAVARKLDAVRLAVALPGVRVLDLSDTLPTARFVHPDLHPDEHLDREGRASVAAAVGAALREFPGFR